MNKKGFTLIELLAIIVILAVIAVITVPIILGIIDNAEMNSSKDSAYGFKDAVEKYYMRKAVQDPQIELPNGYINISELPEDFSVSGQAPSDGWVKLKKGIVEKFSLKYKDYVATMDNDKNITSEKQDRVLPHVTNDYQEVEYLESTGTQYIDTGYKAVNRLKITGTTYTETTGKEMAIIGIGKNSETALEIGFSTTGKFFVYSKKSANINSPYIYNNKISFIAEIGDDLPYKKLTLNINNNETVTSEETNNNYHNSNINLFTLNQNYYFEGKTYDIKIYDDETIVRNFVPVIRKSDNKPGMLDVSNYNKNLFNANIISGKYMNSSGTEGSQADWKYSDYIELKPDTDYSFSVNTTAGPGAKHCFYNENKAFILCINSGTQIFKTPSNAKYARFSFRSSTTEIMLNEGTETLPYQPYKDAFYTNAGTGEFITGPEI